MKKDATRERERAVSAASFVEADARQFLLLLLLLLSVSSLLGYFCHH